MPSRRLPTCWRSAPSASAPTRSTSPPRPERGHRRSSTHPFSNTRSVVELVIAEIISLARHLTDKNAKMHAGVWDKSAKGAHEVRGRTLGIVGYGNIGSQLSVVAEALGMRVYFYDVADKLALGNAKRCETPRRAARKSPRRSRLHVDGRPGNAGLFGAEQFAKMRPRSLFLNLCRGFVVDHEALREHLLSGHIAGAALDVFAEEPKSAGDPFATSLQGLPNVILTPHIGGSTEEAQNDIGRFVAGKLRDYADSGHTTMSVNLPQVSQPPRRPGGAGCCTFTRTCPGCWPRSTGCWPTPRVNIEGQMLSTRGELGLCDHRRGRRPDGRIDRQAGGSPRDRTPPGSGLMCAELVEACTVPFDRLRAHHEASAARRIRGGSQDGQRTSASRSLRVHQPTSVSSSGAFTNGSAPGGANAVNVTVICRSPPSVTKNSDSRYVSLAAERSRPTSSATSRRAVISRMSAIGLITSTWPPIIPILFGAYSTVGARTTSSQVSPR